MEIFHCSGQEFADHVATYIKQLNPDITPGSNNWEELQFQVRYMSAYPSVKLADTILIKDRIPTELTDNVVAHYAGIDVLGQDERLLLHLQDQFGNISDDDTYVAAVVNEYRTASNNGTLDLQHQVYRESIITFDQEVRSFIRPADEERFADHVSQDLRLRQRVYEYYQSNNQTR